MKVLTDNQMMEVAGGFGTGTIVGTTVGGGLGAIPAAFLFCLGGRGDFKDFKEVLPFVIIPAAIGAVVGFVVDCFID